MKELISLLFLLVLAGCATTQSYDLQVTEYEKPLPHYPLKLTAYYKPNLEGNQLIELEYKEYKAKAGHFRVVYGSIIVKKFDSAFARMFRETERSLVSDRATRLLEAKSKDSDLLCDIKLLNNSFKWEKQEGFVKDVVKGILNPFPRKSEYSAETDFEIKISFYKPDGSVMTESTYPYAITEPLYLSLSEWAQPLLEKSNGQFSRGIDEIIGRAVDDLSNLEEFKKLVSSREMLN